jgi:hypothetical protein
MGFFQYINYKYVLNWKFNNHFEMKGDKHCELGYYTKSISNIYLDE